MTAAWNRPQRLPVFFDLPDVPPDARIRIRAGMTPLRLALAIIHSGGWHAAVGGLLLVVFNVANTLVPLAVGAAIDRGIGPITRGVAPAAALAEFLLWAGVIAGLFVVVNLSYRFGGRMGWFSMQRAQYELSARVLERLLDARGVAGPAQLPGRMLSVATSDSTRSCSALYFAIYPLGNVVAIAVAAVSLFAIAPPLGLLVVVGAPLLLGAMALVAAPLRARTEQEQDAVADASATAADLVAGFRVLSGIRAGRAAAEHYRGASRAALRRSLAATTAEATVIGVDSALTAVFAGVITVTAAVAAFAGTISVGELIAAAALAQLVLQPLRELSEIGATLGAQVLASAGRIVHVLQLEPHPAALGSAPVPTAPRIGVGGIEIHPGDFVAIDPAVVDADRAMAAFGLRTTDAEVTLDGRTLHTHDPGAVRRMMLVAPHHADLLERTVRENVGAGPRARAALHTACCESLEHELPLGFDTPLGDGGRTLSGGQRQRVALARAVANDAPVLVLHEPTNAVDSVTEHAIAGRLHAARIGRTTIVFTSSPALHAVADRSLRA